MEWKETESFEGGPKAAESLEFQEGQTEEREQYEPEDVVRIYIQVNQKEDMQKVVERISEEALEGEKLEVHSIREEAGILTANVRYEQVSQIQDVEGVVSVELTGKGEISQEEGGRPEPETETGGSEKKETERPGQPAQETRVEAVQKELEKPAENSSFLWLIGGVVFLFLMAAAWKGSRKQRKNSQERKDKKK